MLSTGRYLYVGFMCHQVIEKILKGYFVHLNKDNPPYIHSLLRLSKSADFYDELSDEQKDLLDYLQPLYIEARYPTYKADLLKSLTKEKCEDIFIKTKDLYHMDKREVLDKVQRFSKIVVEKYQPEKIILFGSYARGNYTEDSDIDVAVIVDSIDGDFLDSQAELYKLRRNIDVSIEPVLLKNGIDNSGFLETILNYGEVIYQKQCNM